MIDGARREEVASVRPNRPLIVLVSVTAMVLGLAPAALVIHKAWLIPYVALGALLVSVPTARVMRTPSRVRATLPEVLIATLNGAALPSLVGLFWLLIHLLVFGAVWVYNAITHSHANAGFIATACSITVMAVIAAFLAWYATEDICSALYPTDREEHTKFYPFATHPGGLRDALIAVAISGAAVSLAAIFLGPNSAAVWLIVLGAVALGGFSLEPLQAPPPPYERVSREVVEHIGLAFADSGYEYRSYPRTSNPEIDPLLAEVDLFIYNNERSFTVEIKQAKAGEPALSWTVGTTVLNAARALAGTGSLGTATEVWPLLIILDGVIDETLTKFCQEKQVSLVSLDRANGRSEVVGSDTQVLNEFARRYLHADPGRKGSPSARPRRRRQERRTS